MVWKWESYGNEDGKVIALIAPSNGVDGADGQERIKTRIKILIEKGFRVMVPRYEDGNLVVEATVEGRTQSQVAGKTVSPAVSADVGTRQIIDAIENGWDIMPYMGGDGFQDKIPLIVQYFEKNPDKKNPHVRIFGMSNATYATILSSRGICSFISTPFASCFMNAKTDSRFAESAVELERVMKGEDYEVASKVIDDPENKLKDLTQTFHYPLNSGNMFWENDKEDRINRKSKDPNNTKTIEEIRTEEELRSLQIPKDQSWSISIEGFLQGSGKQTTIGYARGLEKFLELHKDHLPSFIEIGNLVTRFDGAGGYANLSHDEKTGEILIEENVDKVHENYVRAAEKAKLEGKPILLPVEIGGIDVMNITKDNVRNILALQNAIQKQVIDEIKKVAVGYEVPLTQNTRNGHCSNMSVVGGGYAEVEVKEDKMFKSFKSPSLEKPSTTTHFGHISPTERSEDILSV